MRNFIIILAFLSLQVASNVMAQELTLAEVERIAVENTYDVEYSKLKHQRGTEVYNEYLALRKWRLDLNLDANYSRMSFDPIGSYVDVNNYNMVSSFASLDMQMPVTKWGGVFYAQSELMWSSFLDKGHTYYPRLFGNLPLRVGYRNELLGYNQFKHDKRINDFQYMMLHSELQWEIEETKRKAVTMFFDLAEAQMQCEVKMELAANADSLYNIGKEKLHVGAITIAEVYRLQVMKQLADESLVGAQTAMKNAELALRSFLHFDVGVQIPRLTITDIDEGIIPKAENAVEMALANSSEIMRKQLELLRTAEKADRVRKESGVRAGIDVSVGAQGMNRNFGRILSRPELYSVAEVKLTIPIVDQGVARVKRRVVQKELEMVQTSLKENKRQISTEIIKLINTIDACKTLAPMVKRTMRDADMAMEMTRDNYAMGIATFESFTTAQQGKDDAYANYISVYRDMWESYAMLRCLILQ